MVTTIQISDKLQKELAKRKMFVKETYEEVIWELIEDDMELSEQTKKDIEASREEIRQGKSVTLDDAKRRLGL
jgi:predicted transcriptional regulator